MHAQRGLLPEAQHAGIVVQNGAPAQSSPDTLRELLGAMSEICGFSGVPSY